MKREMDPSQYPPPNGLPQESKLATYMNHSSTPPRPLNQPLGALNIESPPPPPPVNKVLITEYVPLSYFTPANILPETAGTSPPSLACLPINPQVHQENVGGTTYFYSTNDSLNNPGALNASASLAGSESCLGAGLGPGTASAYATHMYPPPTHMGPMTSKPVHTASAYATHMYPAPTYMGPMTSKPVHTASAYATHMYPAPTYMGPMTSKPVITASAYATHMYPAPTYMGPMTSTPGLAASFYTPETIRNEICQRNEDVFLRADFRQYSDLPENVEMYTELIPLEGISPHSIASSFRVVHRQSGDHYAMRRLHGYVGATARLEVWKQVDHPNVVRLHDCFTTNAFGDHSLILVYEYHPTCATLMSKYLTNGGAGNSSDGSGAFHDPFSSDPDAPRPYTHQKNAMLRAVACGALLPEAVLWSLLVQLTAALRIIHNTGLACRTLDLTKVVIIGCRVRIAWSGAADATHPNINDVGQAQQDDLTALGRLILALACRSVHCDNLAASMDLVARTYSADLKNLMLYLLTPSPGGRSVTDLMPMIGARFYTQVEAMERRADVLEDQLSREIDNGRLLRILIKLGIVNERPELNLDMTWAETGNRYMLKLFRDYLFHTVTLDGRPWLDQAHVVHCLNQLDGGTNDKVELMSRDEQSILVVTYAELKHCLEQAFDEVMQGASTGP